MQKTPKVDIRPCDLKIVQDILGRHLSSDFKVWVFGSRATWQTKVSSDLDLAIEGKEKISFEQISQLSSEFEESDLPYPVDIVDMLAIDENFRKIVERDRVLFVSHKA